MLEQLVKLLVADCQFILPAGPYHEQDIIRHLYHLWEQDCVPYSYHQLHPKVRGGSPKVLLPGVKGISVIVASNRSVLLILSDRPANRLAIR